MNIDDVILEFATRNVCSEGEFNELVQETSRKLDAVIGVHKDGKALFLVFDRAEKKLRAVGTMATDAAADEFFGFLSKTIFKRHLQAELGLAEAVALVEAVANKPKVAPVLGKELRSSISGFLAKQKKKR